MSEPTIPLSEPCLGGNASRYLQECLDTNFVSSVGPFVGRFESEFAEFLGSPNAVACSSGTAAIHVALNVAGVGPGDEVMVSDFTFIATVNPIRYVGAVPILVDSEPVSWSMDAGLIAEEIRRRAKHRIRMPKAVLVAHILGIPADLAPIIEVCQEYEITVIEDAAEALGASYSSGPLAGRQVGTFGTLGCFSFNGNKIITTGGGGMIVTANKSLARRARHLTTQAKLPGAEYFHDEIGYNYRLTNLAAALGTAQLELLDQFITKKRAIATRYNEAFSAVPGLTPPPAPPWAAPTYWLYSLLVNPAITGIDRTQLSHSLAARCIATRPIWAPAHIMPFYKNAQRLGGMVGEDLFARGLSLPSSVGLNETAQEQVIAAVIEIIQGRSK